MVITVVFFIALGPWNCARAEAASLQRPVLEKAASYNYQKIRLTWKPVPGAEGYQVYRATSEKGPFKRIKVIDNPEQTAYINGSRVTGKKYYYKIRAYKAKNGRKIYSGFSAVKSAYARPVKVRDLDAQWQQTGYKLTWSPVKGADGYQVAVRQEGDSEWRKGWYYKAGNTYEETIFVGNIVVNGTEALVQTGNCRYEFKVRAWTLSGGKKVYGLYSDAVSPVQKVTAEELKAAAESYIVQKYPQTKLITSSVKTPENSSWGPVWPKSYSRYISAEDIVANQLGMALDFYAENFWNVSAGGIPAGSIFVREVDGCLSVWWIA